jgi:hypothetical protein
MKKLFLPDDYKGVVNRENPNFEIIETGKSRLSMFDGVGDGYLIEYDESSGFNLYVLLNRVTGEELEAFKPKNYFEIAFTQIYDCGVVCLKFGSMPWGDANFEPRLYTYPLSYPILDEHTTEGLAFNVIVVDPSENGLVKSIRMIGLGHEFSMKFIEWCKNQYNTKTADFDKEKYYAKTIKIREDYTTNELVAKASFRWKLYGGEEKRERDALSRDGR